MSTPRVEQYVIVEVEWESDTPGVANVFGPYGKEEAEVRAKHRRVLNLYVERRFEVHVLQLERDSLAGGYGASRPA